MASAATTTFNTDHGYRGGAQLRFEFWQVYSNAASAVTLTPHNLKRIFACIPVAGITHGAATGNDCYPVATLASDYTSVTIAEGSGMTTACLWNVMLVGYGA